MRMTLTSVPGILVGHATDASSHTGCTAILCPEGFTPGIHVPGFAPASRETELIYPEALVESVHGLCLSGGSAFGLAAATGVVRFLQEQHVGFETPFARVPIVPGAAIFDLDLNAFLTFSERVSESVVISLRRMENVARYGMVRLLPSGKIARFEEKGAFQGAGWINAGIYRIRREVLEQIPEQTLCSLEREIFPRLAENGELAGYPAEGMFIDIGTPESFLEAQKLFEKGFVQ